MALAIDSQMPSNAGVNANNNTITYAFNNVAGTLIVIPAVYGNGVAAGFTGITYAGAALTQVGSTLTWDGGNSALGLFYKLNPATGSNNVIVTATGVAGGSSQLTSGAISFTGNHAVTPIAQFSSATATSTAISANLTGVASGSIVLEAAGAGSAINANSDSLSYVINVNGLSAGGNSRCNTKSGASGSVTLTQTVSASDLWMAMIIEIAAAAGGVVDGLEWRSPVPAWMRSYDPVVITD